MMVANEGGGFAVSLLVVSKLLISGRRKFSTRSTLDQFASIFSGTHLVLEDNYLTPSSPRFSAMK